MKDKCADCVTKPPKKHHTLHADVLLNASEALFKTWANIDYQTKKEPVATKIRGQYLGAVGRGQVSRTG